MSEVSNNRDWHIRARIAERERDEARAKLAEYERWQGEAEKVGEEVSDMYFDYNCIGKLTKFLVPALTAAHARGYAAGVAQEREECAKVAGPQYTDCQFEELTPTGKTLELMRADIAAAIRNRSTT